MTKKIGEVCTVLMVLVIALLGYIALGVAIYGCWLLAKWFGLIVGGVVVYYLCNDALNEVAGDKR